MPSTKPITPQEFWPLFEAWARARITPGTLWLPQGWSEWATLDFHAFALTQSLGETGNPALPLDLQQSSQLTGGDTRLALLANQHHTDTACLTFQIEAQSMLESASAYEKKIARELQRLGEAPMSGLSGDVTPMVIALCFAPVDASLRAAAFKPRFTVAVGGASGQSSTLVQSLSRRIARQAQGGNAPVKTDAAARFDAVPIGGAVTPAPDNLQPGQGPTPGATAAATGTASSTEKTPFSNLFPPP